MASPKTYPRRNHVPWRAIDTEAIVVDVKAGLLYPLNSVARRIWDLCDGERSADEIIQTIAAEFDADEATIRADTTRFLEALAEAKLVAITYRPHPVSAPASRAPRNQRGE